MHIDNKHIESSIRSRQNVYVLSFLLKINLIFSFSDKIIYLEHRIVECKQAASVQVRNTFPIDRVRSKHSSIQENLCAQVYVIPASIIFRAASSILHILPNNRKHRFVISI